MESQKPPGFPSICFPSKVEKRHLSFSLTEVDEYLIRFGIGFEADSKPGGNFESDLLDCRLLMVWDVNKKVQAFRVRLWRQQLSFLSWLAWFD